VVEIVERSEVARPSDVVWEVLADFGAISRWAPNVAHSCLTTEQESGVGAVRRVQVGRKALLERVVDWDPGHRLAYRVEGLPPVLRSVTNSWEIVGANGSTGVTLTSHVDAGARPPQKVVARVAGRVMARASRQMLAGLKAQLEQVPS
jgi:carbon monoxide dehydrogenase subunit G